MVATIQGKVQDLETQLWQVGQSRVSPSPHCFPSACS